MLKNKVINAAYEFIKPHKWLATKALILSVLVYVLEVTSTALVLPLTQVLGNNQVNTHTQSSGLLNSLVNLYTNIPESWQLLSVVLSLFFITIIKNLSSYFSHININDFMLRSGTILRQKCVERFLELELPFYTRTGLGELLSYVNEQAQRSEQFFSRWLELLREIVAVTLLLCFLIILSPALTIVTVVSLTLVALSLRAVIAGIRVYGRRSADAIENFSTLMTEIISGIRVVKSFNAELRELHQTKQALQERYKAELTAFRFYSAVAPVTETVGISVLLIILITGVSLFSNAGNVTLPILLTYTLTLLRTLPRVNHLNGLRSEISLLQGSFEAVQEFLSSTANSELPDGQQHYQGLQSELVLENLTFTFPNNSEPTLCNINFTVKKGTTTAIVGPSGSGKSTLVDLVMRFYDPESGNIRIDGIDLRNLQIGSWRRAIAMVSQDTFLFNASIKENIAYGRPDATESEIIIAAKKAYAYEFIQDLPQGFDTIVGNRGTRLSGGQRQRIAIARAILCDPDILILDEATSALDSKSERIVQQAIEEVSRDRTVIVIAHRLSTIEKAHKIVVLQDGKLVEQGTHQELLVNRGTYYSLYQSQSFSDNSIIKTS
ncbi:ABC transporter ATP-binding protein [Fischerella sp. JS2]|uniref:ABC transporter ATP-binding protein n=1 Tax=Fischerella sp. JS2 TaxID=2597771 RepID=UPI0028E48F7C|nr:ABC transporter ATP-binding protein [Fischerella sp. JS2]